MNTTRFLKLIVGAVVIVAVLVAFQAYNSSGSTKGTSSSPAGMGDLHRFEAGPSSVNSGALNSDRSSAGMGDLHFLEARQPLLDTNSQNSSRSYAGMGDLHRLEAQVSSSLAPGMGDLHRFEGQQ